MARYALGLVRKKSKPDRALALFDDAAELAASVQNFWWHGIALMEAAATRAVHGETATAAKALIDVIDHWDRVGDWSQQWLNLRYVTRFLVRVGADDDALTLHHALVAAGKGSPLTRTECPHGAANDESYGPEAVAWPVRRFRGTPTPIRESTLSREFHNRRTVSQRGGHKVIASDIDSKEQRK